MSVNTKMTAIANEIRTLSETTGKMGLDAMATHIGNANTEIVNQENLLAQIAEALNGKASGESGVELPELTNPASQNEIFLNKEVIDENGNIKVGTFTIENELTEQESLIAQIQSVVDNLPDADSGDSESSFPYNVTVNANYDINYTIGYTHDSSLIIILVPTTLLLSSVEVSGGYCHPPVQSNEGIYFHISDINQDLIVNIVLSSGDYD